MRIRCERCATTYELDEKRLPPHGALVKCTRCDHVFRAAPPGAVAEGAPAQPPAPQPADAGRSAGEERTAIFGYGAGAQQQEDRTAPIPAPAPIGPARPSAARPVAARPVAPRNAEARASGTKGRRVGWWVLAALLLAAAAGLGWYLVQSRVATPTTRLPAGALLLPT